MSTSIDTLSEEMPGFTEGTVRLLDAQLSARYQREKNATRAELAQPTLSELVDYLSETASPELVASLHRVFTESTAERRRLRATMDQIQTLSRVSWSTLSQTIQGQPLVVEPSERPDILRIWFEQVRDQARRLVSTLPRNAGLTPFALVRGSMEQEVQRVASHLLVAVVHQVEQETTIVFQIDAPRAESDGITLSIQFPLPEREIYSSYFVRFDLLVLRQYPQHLETFPVSDWPDDGTPYIVQIPYPGMDTAQDSLPILTSDILRVTLRPTREESEPPWLNINPIR